MKKETLTLAFCIALFPPIWAVAAPYVHVNTGAVALICAGLYVTNGNKYKDGVKISLGFLLGDLWSYIAMVITEKWNGNKDIVLFVTLFVLGGLAVIVSSFIPKWIHCPSWLCGWAIGLTILTQLGYDHIGTYPLQIGISMLVGVWYVGAMLDAIQKKMSGVQEKRKQ